MKYTVAWASALTQNQILKISVGTLSIALVLFTFSTLRLALRPPLIIDRECKSAVVRGGAHKHTEAEMGQFVRVSLESRFNTEVEDFRAYLSEDEVQYRLTEQADFTKKAVIQKILVNSVKLEGKTATVDADRILSVGKVRSALAFPLKVTLASTGRNSANPYGIILKKVSPVQEEAAK